MPLIVAVVVPIDEALPVTAVGTPVTLTVIVTSGAAAQAAFPGWLAVRLHVPSASAWMAPDTREQMPPVVDTR